MLRFSRILLITCLITVSLSQSVYLVPSEIDSQDNFITIEIENQVFITSLIFYVSGVTLEDYFGPMVVNSMVSINSELGMVIISPLLPIPPQNGDLIYLTFTDVDSNSICIEDAYGNAGGDELDIHITDCFEFDFTEYFTVGDINFSGEVDVLDVMVLVNFILLSEPPTSYQLWAGNLNSDEILDILDVILLVNTILGE